MSEQTKVTILEMVHKIQKANEAAFPPESQNEHGNVIHNACCEILTALGEEI